MYGGLYYTTSGGFINVVTCYDLCQVMTNVNRVDSRIKNEMKHSNVNIIVTYINVIYFNNYANKTFGQISSRPLSHTF